MHPSGMTGGCGGVGSGGQFGSNDPRGALGVTYAAAPSPPPAATVVAPGVLASMYGPAVQPSSNCTPSMRSAPLSAPYSDQRNAMPSTSSVGSEMKTGTSRRTHVFSASTPKIGRAHV